MPAKSNVSLSAISILDDLPYLEYIPWKESILSTLGFVDELIVVHGGKLQPDGRCLVKEFVDEIDDSRVKFLTFPWPEKFDWRQIAIACTFGQLHATGDWCFRVLGDEVFPQSFVDFKGKLVKQPESVKIVSVQRLYMLGNSYACPFHDKPLFFRNDRSIGYGTVNPQQGDEASYGLFDDPIETDKWFDGERVVSIKGNSLLRDKRAIERLLNGEVPEGYRGQSTKLITKVLTMGILNVDVNFYPDELLYNQKELSLQGYRRLPPEYPKRPVMSREEIKAALELKLEGMIKRGKLERIDVPEPLLRFIDHHAATRNMVREICECVYGFPWDRVSRQGVSFKFIVNLFFNKVRNFMCRLSY